MNNARVVIDLRGAASTVQNDIAAAFRAVAQRVPATVMLPFHCQFCGHRYDRLAYAFGGGR